MRLMQIKRDVLCADESKKARALRPGFSLCGSLALTYFRMRKRHTIIGAAPFHGPVRDGKAWFQSAMGTRHNLSPRCACSEANSKEVWVEIAKRDLESCPRL